MVAIAAIGLAAQWSTYLNHDVSWILYSTRRMLDGAVFGRDIIAVNPPLAWFLSMPAVLASKWFDWPLDAAFRGLVATVAGVSLAYCYSTMRDERPVVRLAATLALAYLLFIGVGRDFGQREHLSLILVLPYLASSAKRAEGQRPGRLGAILVGIAAGLGIALKPYFFAIPVLVELVLPRAGMPRQLIRTETVAMAATALLYLAAVLVFTPEYLTAVVPLAAKVYWGFENSPLILLLRTPPALLGFGALICISILGKRRAFASVLCAAALGYALAYFVQSKGYTYQAMPMNFLIIAAAVYLLADLVCERPGYPRTSRLFRIAAILTAFSLLPVTEKAIRWYWEARPGGKLAREIEAVVETVNSHARGASFLAISTHPFPGFPTAIYADSLWAGRTNSQIALPAVIKMYESTPVADIARLQESEAFARSVFLQDLSSAQPALILVDAREIRHAIGRSRFDLLAFYRADPAIDAILRHYHEMPSVGGFRVLIRRGS